MLINWSAKKSNEKHGPAFLIEQELIFVLNHLFDLILCQLKKKND